MDTQNNNIDRILKHHGKRTQPDDLMQKRAEKNVHAHWQANLQRQQKQKKTRQTNVLRIAASVLFMIGAIFLTQYNLQENNPSIISNIYVKNTIQISHDGSQWQEYNQQPLTDNTWVKTNSDGFVSLTLLDNSQLRLDNNTKIQLINATEIRLLNGQIYHDADNANQNNHLTLSTTLGNIKHIGTRYSVLKNGTTLQVSVRNGLIEISNNKVKTEVQSGKQLTLTQSGEHSESTISAYDRAWSWTQNAAQPFNSQGKSLHDFVTWYAHENGYQITWNNHKAKTKRVKLAGNVSNLGQSQQIKTIFLATKFDYEINQGILTIL